jgi:hypothetical protein
MFAQQAHANGRVSASPLSGDTICSAESSWEYPLESTAEDGFYEPADTASPPATRVDAANLLRALQQLEVIAKRQAPRIACKANGRISFLNLAEIVAVHAEGNYVSLQHRPNPYLLRESLSSIAEKKLKPYGFIRIHRSVVVNISAKSMEPYQHQELEPLPEVINQRNQRKKFGQVFGQVFEMTQNRASRS